MSGFDSSDKVSTKKIDGSRQSPLSPKRVNQAPAMTMQPARNTVPSVAPPLPAASPDELIGKTIDNRFRIISLLGKGGMSEVYKAEHLLLQKTVAIKILLPQQETRANGVERFQQEAKAISALDHPSIIRVYAFGVSGARFYLAMDFLEGESLSDILEEEKVLPWQRSVRLAVQISDGLQHAHSRGVIHRDLKPSNIIVQTDENGGELAKIVDFGIARLTSESGKEIKQLTLEGRTCGSPPYMSPEQCLGEPVDERTDIYSFGCMLYELLCGKRPFKAPSSVEVMQMHVEQSPKFFRTVAPGVEIPQSLEAIVRKCMAKDPNLRYQTMAELNGDLKSVGSSTEQENNLDECLEKEVAESRSTSNRQFMLCWVLPIASSILLGAASLAIYLHFSPQPKLMQLKHDISAISLNDPHRFEKMMMLIPQSIELNIKTGDRGAALLQLQQLDRNVSAMPVSIARCKAQAKIARYYSRLGKQTMAQVLTNSTIAELENYLISRSLSNVAQFREVETGSLLIIKLCGDDPDKRDHILGQYTFLVSIYLRQGRYVDAERICRAALQLVQSKADPGNINQITQLCNLASTLTAQRRVTEAETALAKAWELCQVSWSSDSAISRSVAKRLADCYLSQGKKAEAAKIMSDVK